MLITVRIAAVADAEQAALLQQEVWRDAYPNLADPQMRSWSGAAERTAHWACWLGTAVPATVTLSAQVGSDLVGLCRVGPCRPGEGEPGWGAVQGLMVDPVVRGRGIGSQLLGAALEELSALGMLEVTTWVLGEDIRSLRFWRRAGFLRDGLWLTRPDLGSHEVRLVRREPLPGSLPRFD